MKKLATAVLLLGLGASACRDGGGSGDVDILPNVSPARLGQMYPLGENDPEPGTTDRVPYELVILLKTENGGLDIEKVCLEGSADALLQFALEGPQPPTPKRDEDAALRITYERQAPGGPDNIAVVVQSNADNFPTLVIPVCAQVVAEGSERIRFECTSPVTVAPGARDDTLCN